MHRFLAKHRLLKKLLVTVLILVVYISGRSIPLPHVVLTAYLNLNPFLDTAVSLTGGSLSQVGVFSLGLGPVMSSMLLGQLFTLGRRQRILAPRLLELRRYLLLLGVAIIQGMSLAINLTYQTQPASPAQIIQVTSLLVTGAVVLSWLANLNGAYGLGGSSAILLTSILLGQERTVGLVRELWQEGEVFLVVGALIWGLLTIFLMVWFDRSEYRIPIQRMAIHNSYASGSYLPIKVNIVGGMPLMYVYVLLSFIQYLFLLLGTLVPAWSGLSALSAYLMPTSWPGLLVYLAIVALLTWLLSAVNIDVISLTESMRQGGDYIPHVRAGRQTQLYLRRYVRFFAAFNALYLMVLSGLPLLVSLVYPKAQPLSGLVGMLMLAAGMLLAIREEIKVMRLRKLYTTLFDQGD